MEETAIVEREATIKFQERRASPRDGSWNLMGVKFSRYDTVNTLIQHQSCDVSKFIHHCISSSRPAKLNSFAVVNFSSDKRSCHHFMTTTLKVMGNHGIDIASEVKGDRNLDLVTEHYSRSNPVPDVS